VTLYNARTTIDPTTLAVTKFDTLGNVESTYETSDSGCTCPAGHRPMCRHRAMLPNLRPIADTHWFYDFDRHDVVDLNGMTKATFDRIAMREQLSKPIQEPYASLADALRDANIPGVQVFDLSRTEPATLHNAIAEAVGEPAIKPATSRMRR
jgi:hypothetical protein